jgi:HEAT repeat protein
VNVTPNAEAADRLRAALTSPSSSDRLQAALSAGTHPNPAYIDVLVERCAVEPDFYVRDMLTWSLIRHPPALTVPRLVAETKAARNQARGQALHTLSKIGDPAGWAAITDELLRDADDSVARPAWRAAVLLAPDDEKPALAGVLITQLGRGGRDVQLSLSRAFAELGQAAAEPLAAASDKGEVGLRIHAIATARLIEDPEEGFDTALFEAERIVVFDSPGAQPGGDRGPDQA